MDGLAPTGMALLVGGGLVAGIVNTLAGGGSLLTVPLLVLVGLPGTFANGTNRIGLLLQCLVAVWRFRAHGLFEMSRVTPVLVPVVIGAGVGALAVTRVADATFERIFGALMLLLLVPTLRSLGTQRVSRPPDDGWKPATTALVFFGVGLYGGAFQAGLGIPLLFALSHSGLDLVRANAVKLAVIAAVTLTAIPVFLWEGRIVWLPAALLAAGFSVGGELGARIAVHGGERVIRPILALAVIALAARMFGLL